MPKSINRKLADLISADGTVNNDAIDTISFISNVEVYNSIDLLPTSNLIQNQAAFVASDDQNARLYISNGTGWYNTALINTAPVVLFDSSSYSLDSGNDSVIITLNDSDFDQGNLTPAVFTFQPSNIVDSAITIANTTDDQITLTVKETAEGTYNFKIFGSKSDGTITATDSATINLVLYVLTLVGAQSITSSTETSLIINNDVSSTFSSNDIIAYSDGSNEATITSVNWPNNVSPPRTVTVNSTSQFDILNANYASSFTAGRIISKTINFSTGYSSISSSDYYNGYRYDYAGTVNVRGYLQGLSSYNGLYTSNSGIPGFSPGNKYSNNTTNSSNLEITLPYAGVSRNFPYLNLTNSGTVNILAVHNGGQVIEVLQDQSHWNGGHISTYASANSNTKQWARCISAVFTPHGSTPPSGSSFANATTLTFSTSTDYPMNSTDGYSFSTGTQAYASSNLSVTFYRMDTQTGRAGFATSGIGRVGTPASGQNNSFFKNSNVLENRTRVNHSTNLSLSTGNTIYVGDNETEIQLSGNGLNYDNTTQIYLKT